MEDEVIAGALESDVISRDACPKEDDIIGPASGFIGIDGINAITKVEEVCIYGSRVAIDSVNSINGCN